MNWFEVIDQLRDELLAGKTGSQIATTFNVTRSAAIAAVHRFRDELGVGFLRQVVEKPQRPSVQTKRNYVKLVRGEMSPQSGRVTRPPNLDTFDKSQVGSPLAKLRHSQCRWPVSANDAPQILFCRRPKVPGTSYCDVHNFWSRKGNELRRR